MWLLMKGGGTKSKRHWQEPSAPERESIGTVHPEHRTENIVRWQRRSNRLNLKRQREVHNDCIGPSQQVCPLCEEELKEKNAESLEDLTFCWICGRGFHLSCSGI